MIVLQLHLKIIFIRFLNFIYLIKLFYTAYHHVSCTTKTNIKSENMLTVTSNLVFEIPAIHTCTVICGNTHK